MLVSGHQRLRGTAALQVTDHRCRDRMAIAGRSPGGRPLRRRRETVLIYGRQRLRGTAALQASTDHRCHQRMATACYFGRQDTNEQQRWNPFEVTFKVEAVTLDLELFERTPLNPEPFEYLVAQEFVKREARDGIIHDYPKVQKPGSFPLSEMTFGPRFKELLGARG
jgi:hypothetical protein